MTRDGSDPGAPVIDDAHKYDLGQRGETIQLYWAKPGSGQGRGDEERPGDQRGALEFNWHITRPDTPGIFEANWFTQVQALRQRCI